MTKFNYNDIVCVRPDFDSEFYRGRKAWIVGVFENRPGPYFDKFPIGVVYSVEFEDGSSTEFHESDLELVEAVPPTDSDVQE